MRRWWILALVFTLALSLTSCSSKTSNLQGANYGMTQCDGSLGSFDVYLIAQNTGDFQLAIIPVSPSNPGDIVTVNVVDQQSMSYRTLEEQVVINADQEIDFPITAADAQNYDTLALTLFQPGVSFPDVQSQEDAFCYLPQIGDGTTN
jgi:hypothetical protein